MTADITEPTLVASATPSRRATFWVVVTLVVMVAVIVGVSVYVLRRGHDACPGALADNIDRRPPTAVEIVMVDHVSTDPSQFQLVLRDVRQLFAESLGTGTAIQVVVDNGDHGDVRSVSCLDGTRAFDVRRRNSRRVAADRVSAAAASAAHLGTILGDIGPSMTGGPLRLLEYGAIVAHGHALAGRKVRDVRLYSDFFGNGADCLGAGTGFANPEKIDVMVARCAQQTRPAYQLPVRLVGVGESWRAHRFEQWTRDLASRYCAEILPKGCVFG